MSKKTVVITTCNGCKGTLADIEPAHEYIVSAGRKQYEIDLCGICNEEFTLYFAVPAPPSRDTKVKKARSRKKTDDVPCPECDRAFVNAHGLQVHIARSHKKK